MFLHSLVTALQWNWSLPPLLLHLGLRAYQSKGCDSVVSVAILSHCVAGTVTSVAAVCGGLTTTAPGWGTVWERGTTGSSGSSWPLRRLSWHGECG